jgi:hypothetical protein
LAAVKGDKRLAKAGKPIPLEGSLYDDVIAGYSPAMAAFRRGISAVDAQTELLREHEKRRADRATAPELELARLDAMLVKLQPGIDEGNIQSIDQARKLSERRCKMLGLDASREPDDAPQRVTVEFSFAASGADAKDKPDE